MKNYQGREEGVYLSKRKLELVYLTGIPDVRFE